MAIRTPKSLARQWLRKHGWQVSRLRHDFDSHFLTREFEQRIREHTKAAIGDYFRQRHPFPITANFDLESSTDEFFELYKANPVKTIGGGCGFNSLLALFLVVRSFDPKLVIDSGTFQGGSAWVLRRAASAAELHSFDIDLSNLVVSDSSIHFHQRDWSSYSFESIDSGSSLAFFDDHQDQIDRTLQAHEKGFRYLVFDDNTPLNWLYLARDGVATIDFLADAELLEHDRIQWSMLGQAHEYSPCREKYRRAQEVINTIVKLPDLHLITGCAYHVPLTLVRLESD